MYGPGKPTLKEVYKEMLSVFIGTKGYIGTGWNGESNSKDFWEYDQATDVWTKKADFGGIDRSGAVGFSIGTKGYIGTGWTGWNDDSSLKDFWDMTRLLMYGLGKPTLKESAEAELLVFSIGTKGYIGTGWTGWNDDSDLRDFWEYDQELMFGQKSRLGGTARSGAVGFSTDTKDT